MEEVIFETPWIQVKRTPRGFDYLERKGVNSVAVFLIRRTDNSKTEVLIRLQPLCVHNADIDDQQMLFACPVTGGIEEDEKPIDSAYREVEEETGYYLIENDLTYLTTYIVGTQTNEKVWLYMADVTDYPKPPKATNDGTYFESISRNEWRTLETLRGYEYVACQLGYYLIKARLAQMVSQ
jgi:8-oxo-dGTP pyrophosphatase MutT (NUDIX family)